MEDTEEDRINKAYSDFITEEGYEVRFAEGPDDADHSKVIEKFKEDGYEVFSPNMGPVGKTIITARKKKTPLPIKYKLSSVNNGHDVFHIIIVDRLFVSTFQGWRFMQTLEEKHPNGTIIIGHRDADGIYTLFGSHPLSSNDKDLDGLTWVDYEY